MVDVNRNYEVIIGSSIEAIVLEDVTPSVGQYGVSFYRDELVEFSGGGKSTRRILVAHFPRVLYFQDITGEDIIELER